MIDTKILSASTSESISDNLNSTDFCSALFKYPSFPSIISILIVGLISAVVSKIKFTLVDVCAFGVPGASSVTLTDTSIFPSTNSFAPTKSLNNDLSSKTNSPLAAITGFSIVNILIFPSLSSRITSIFLISESKPFIVARIKEELNTQFFSVPVENVYDNGDFIAYLGGRAKLKNEHTNFLTWLINNL